MNKEKLEIEHAQLKERLAELTDFINSKEYYEQSENEKHLIATQRTGMEMYLNSLSLRLWGNDKMGNMSSSSLLPLLMSTMLMPSFSSPTPSFPSLEEKSEGKENV